MSTFKPSDLGLKSLGLSDNISISRNLSYEDLVSDIIKNGEGHIVSSGAAMIDSGEYTGRSPKDKYIVDEPTSPVVFFCLKRLSEIYPQMSRTKSISIVFVRDIA